MADENKLGRKRERANSSVIYCTSNAGHRDNILLADPAHSYVGMSSTVTNVRALRLSVARKTASATRRQLFLRLGVSMVLLLRTGDPCTVRHATVEMASASQNIFGNHLRFPSSSSIRNSQHINLTKLRCTFADHSTGSRGTLGRCVTFA